MLEQKISVINTSPLIALVAAWGTLEPLRSLHSMQRRRINGQCQCLRHKLEMLI